MLARGSEWDFYSQCENERAALRKGLLHNSEKNRIAAAFQGELGAFSHSAIAKLLGSDAISVPTKTFYQVFEAICRGEVQYGVIPIENTLYGSVHENYDHLLHYDLRICGETTLLIEHSLIATPGLSLDRVRQAFSHPVALDQCRSFFEQYPAIRPAPYYDTAGSVKMIMRESPDGGAAIANEKAADLYGAQVLLRGIQDNSSNFTRFFLLTKQDAPSPCETQAQVGWKTSLVFTTSNVPGALSTALDCFASRNLNLSKLESRPLRDSPWEYLFYLDISGSTHDALVQDALIELRQSTGLCKILGSFCPTP